MKTVDIEIKFKGETLNLSYLDDKDFKLYFLNQFGIVNYDTSNLHDKIHGQVTGVLHFILDNIQLPPNPTIIDIGSGNSVVDLGLSKYLNQRANFILVDGNSWNDNNVLHTNEFFTYNSWDMVTNALKLSGLDSRRFSMQDIDYAFDQPADLIISTNSWGLHYPIDVYLDKVVKALRPGGYLVLFPIINIPSYHEAVDKVLDRVFTEPESNWMREGLEWNKWKPYFPNLADSEPTALRCIWQKPIA